MTDIDLSPSDYEACDFKKYLEQLRERIVNRTGIPLAFFNDALALLRVVDKLDKEADWLALVLANASCGVPLTEYIDSDINGMSPPGPEHWREAARKAVEEA